MDTTTLPPGVFLKDLDLMEAYADAVDDECAITIKRRRTARGDRGLANFLRLRRMQHKTQTGYYYYAEYLSQGCIDLRGRSSSTPSDMIINSRLFVLCPIFEAKMGGSIKLSWTNNVNELRHTYQNLVVQRELCRRVLGSEASIEWND